MSTKHKNDLLDLVDQCYFISRKELKSVINSYDGRESLCVFNEDKRMCGFACFEEADDELFLAYLYVEEGYRDRGFGSVLLKNLYKIAKNDGKDFVTLLASSVNKGAVSLYKRNKFLIYRCAPDSATIRMRKYTSNKTYFSGAIIYELEKKFGKQNITKNLQELKKCDYEMFYKYFKAQNSEMDKKIDILLKDKTFLDACAEIENENCLSETQSVGKFVAEDSRSRGKDLKLVLRCVKDFEDQEKFSKVLAEENVDRIINF